MPSTPSALRQPRGEGSAELLCAWQLQLHEPLNDRTTEMVTDHPVKSTGVLQQHRAQRKPLVHRAMHQRVAHRTTSVVVCTHPSDICGEGPHQVPALVLVNEMLQHVLEHVVGELIGEEGTDIAAE